MVFLNGDAVTCIVCFEDYASIGGPYPYHDTYTFSFYRQHADTDTVLAQLTAAATECRLHISEVLHGQDRPTVSAIRWFTSWFKGF